MEQSQIKELQERIMSLKEKLKKFGAETSSVLLRVL